MTTVSLQDVQRAVATWDLQLPGATPRAQAVLQLLSAELHRLLVQQHVSPAEFSAARDIATAECRFFPAPADVLSAVATVRRQPPPAAQVLLPAPEPDPDSDLGPRLKQLYEAAKAGKMSYADAALAMDELIKTRGR